MKKNLLSLLLCTVMLLGLTSFSSLAAENSGDVPASAASASAGGPSDTASYRPLLAVQVLNNTLLPPVIWGITRPIGLLPDIPEAPSEPPPPAIDPDKPMVALTYDDGPHKENTPALLDLLEEYGVQATFFEVGSRLEYMPQFLTRMEELGCEIGNHSYSHSNLTKLSPSQIEAEIENTNALIRAQVGHDAALVRAPGGNVNDTVSKTIPFPFINWSIDTQDWKYRNADHVYDAVTQAGSLDGKIVLMHSLYDSTVEASTRLIPWLLDQGYQLVTVSQLAEARGVTLENGTLYRQFLK